jgi:hypothetical protein
MDDGSHSSTNSTTSGPNHKNDAAGDDAADIGAVVQAPPPVEVEPPLPSTAEASLPSSAATKMRTSSSSSSTMMMPLPAAGAAAAVPPPLSAIPPAVQWLKGRLEGGKKLYPNEAVYTARQSEIVVRFVRANIFPFEPDALEREFRVCDLVHQLGTSLSETRTRRCSCSGDNNSNRAPTQPATTVVAVSSCCSY